MFREVASHLLACEQAFAAGENEKKLVGAKEEAARVGAVFSLSPQPVSFCFIQLQNLFTG